MAKQYHIVVSKTPEEGSKWCIQFGDYDKETAKEELQDMKDHVGDGCTWEKGTKFKLVNIKGDKQKDIDIALSQLNGEYSK